MLQSIKLVAFIFTLHNTWFSVSNVYIYNPYQSVIILLCSFHCLLFCHKEFNHVSHLHSKKEFGLFFYSIFDICTYFLILFIHLQRSFFDRFKKAQRVQSMFIVSARAAKRVPSWITFTDKTAQLQEKS
jgi:hypothetical protein